MISSLSRTVAFAASFASLLQLVSSQNLPVVDLGYERQRATSFNGSGNYYSFSNIRYAAPPVGDLRFRAPQSPAVNRDSIQTGQQDRICAQATPAWQAIIPQYVILSSLYQGCTLIFR